MVVYAVATFISTLFGMLVLKNNSRKKGTYKIDNKTTLLMVCAMLPLVIISAIRYDVGQDYFYTYAPYFNDLMIGKVNANVEVGYMLLNKFVQIFTTNYVGIFVLTSILFFFFMFKAIFEQSENVPLSIFLLVGTSYYFIFLNTMRQMLAISIVLYALKFLKRREFKKYAMWVLLATTIHTSALIMLPVYFLYNIKITPAKAIVIVVFVLVFATVGGSIITGVIQNTKYSSYLETEDGTSGGMVTLLIDFSILVFAFIFYNKENENVKKEDYYFHILMQLIAVIITLIKNSIPLIYRMRWNFSVMVILLIPLALSYEKNKKNKHIYVMGLIILFTLYILYTIGVKNGNNVLPYRTIFNV